MPTDDSPAAAPGASTAGPAAAAPDDADDAVAPDDAAAAAPDDDADDARPYIRIRPADDPLGPATVRHQFRRLHTLVDEDGGGLLARLLPWGGPTPPTVEVLLASTGGPDPRISYYVGVDDPDARDALERTLRSLFPDSYEFEPTAWHPRRLLATTDDASTPAGAPSGHVAAAAFRGRAERRHDWQTQLTPFAAFVDDDAGGTARVPLATVAETMAAAEVPMVYQALLRRKPDWTAAAEQRRYRLRWGTDTQGARLVEWARRELIPEATGRDRPDREAIPVADLDRIDEIEARNTRRSFVVTARAVAVANDDPAAAERAVAELATALDPVGHTCYEIDATVRTGTAAAAVREAVHDRTVHPPTYERLATRLPWVANASPGIVADVTEAPNFCLLDGAALTAAARRGVDPTPGERTARPRPPPDRLADYRGPGFTLGPPLTQDGAPADEPVAVPPSLQPLHLAVVGPTGSGKSVLATAGLLDNHAVTDGATVIVEPKGDGMVVDYLRAHYERYGSLADVYYFDCSEVLPAFSFFDVRDLLEAGVPRDTAVETLTSHYMELLRQVVGRERFASAIRSPDVIQYLVKALFDPANGQDAFGHDDLHAAVRRMHERRSPPTVSQPDLERALNGIVANRARTFDEIMQGVANRIEKLLVDRRLARVFNHVPDEDDPHFDFRDYLDEDVTIIFDLGGLRGEARRVLTLVVLSKLWTACKRRQQADSTAAIDADAAATDANVAATDADAAATDAAATDPDATDADTTAAIDAATDATAATDADTDPAAATTAADPTGDHPLVTLHVEEAASVATSELLNTLLAQGRAFDLAVSLSLQFPAQLQARAPDTYRELLANVGTFVVGPVPVDDELATRLATDDMPPAAVANRLRALERGEWLVTLPGAFGEPAPRPFRVRSPAPPPGHSAGDRPLAPARRALADAAITRARGRTLAEAGLTVGAPGVASGPDDADDAAADSDAVAARVDSALPHTNRLPRCVEYDAALHGLRCRDCDNRYDPDLDGLTRAVECCNALDDVDPDDVPICDLNLKLTPDERAASEWSDAQLMFLQAVYNAQQLRYEPPAYDLLSDSMIRLQEYVGIDMDAVRALIDADLLRHDTDHPHRLYTVTPEGRAVIGESYRRGVDYGHGAGDLEESSEHVFAVEVARRYLERAYVADADSPVVAVQPYYELDERRRLDLAGLDADGEVVVAVEAERVNHDVRRAAPEDFDKLASVAPEEAIWVVMSQSAAHEVLAALNEPLDGEPRVEKTYAETTPPQQFRIDTPGMTAIYPAEYVRDRMLESD